MLSSILKGKEYAEPYVHFPYVFMAWCVETDVLLLYDAAGQLQPTGGPHNSLRARLRAALVCTYIESGEGGRD
jgi:hypothetical protein